ncbi:hypothetical protein C0Q70_20075 [Pomacea canaliculata]|uniref:Uncharacterized protein n=1 Tax=Pomacea canaliculata TaxID=400727 RepID=A0A2T7NEL5_POMCA|nr:hypothetical protein C0Q70_20075 [Pomacea canaliculata]
MATAPGGIRPSRMRTQHILSPLWRKSSSSVVKCNSHSDNRSEVIECTAGLRGRAGLFTVPHRMQVDRFRAGSACHEWPSRRYPAISNDTHPP